MPVVVLALVALSTGAAPAIAAETPAPKVENSALDAPLFYQLLLSEIELRNGQAGTAYQLMKFTAFERTVQGTGASRRLRNAQKVPGIVYGAGAPAMKPGFLTAAVPMMM